MSRDAATRALAGVIASVVALAGPTAARAQLEGEPQISAWAWLMFCAAMAILLALAVLLFGPPPRRRAGRPHP